MGEHHERARVGRHRARDVEQEHDAAAGRAAGAASARSIGSPPVRNARRERAPQVGSPGAGAVGGACGGPGDASRRRAISAASVSSSSGVQLGEALAPQQLDRARELARAPPRSRRRAGARRGDVGCGTGASRCGGAARAVRRTKLLENPVVDRDVLAAARPASRGRPSRGPRRRRSAARPAERRDPPGARPASPRRGARGRSATRRSRGSVTARARMSSAAPSTSARSSRFFTAQPERLAARRRRRPLGAEQPRARGPVDGLGGAGRLDEVELAQPRDDRGHRTRERLGGLGRAQADDRRPRARGRGSRSSGRGSGA